jgi:Flp pilus assembly protein TadG
MLKGRRTERRSGGRRGVAAAELAIILPLLVTVVLAAVDFGRFASAYIAVTNAARAGAGYGMMNNYTASTLTAWQAGITRAARDEISPQVGADNAANLTVTITTSTDNGLQRVQVTAGYPFTTVVNWEWTGLGLPSSVTLQQKVEMQLIR